MDKKTLLKNKKIKGDSIKVLLLLFLTVLVCYFSGLDFVKLHVEEAIYPSPDLTVKKMLSDYDPGLKNSPGDTSVYIFEGKKKGGTLLIIGGTHPNEPAGFITAVLLVENLAVGQGRVIIAPRANNSGFTHSDPQEGNPQRYAFNTPGGKRWFRYDAPDKTLTATQD